MFSCEVDGCNIATYCCTCIFPLPCLCQSCREAHLSKPGYHWFLPLEAKASIASPQALIKVQNKIQQVQLTCQELQGVLGCFEKAKEEVEATYQEILYQLARLKDERLAAINQVAEQYALQLNAALQEVYGSVWKDFPDSAPFPYFLSTHTPGDDKDFDLLFTVDAKAAQVQELLEVKWVLPAFGLPNRPEDAHMLRVILDSGEIVPVIARPSRLIRDILAEITLKRPDLSRNSFFVSGSEVLPKSSTVKDCGLSRTSQIQLLGDLLISVTTETWVQTTVQVNGEIQVCDLILLISEQFMYPPGKLRVLYEEKWLKKKQRLACCGIRSGGALRIVRQTTQPYPIGLLLPDGETQVLKVNNSDLTIALLRDIIKVVFHLPPDLYRLTFAQQDLKAGLPLTYYSIQHNSVLALVPVRTATIQLGIASAASSYTFQADVWSRVAQMKLQAERQCGLSLCHQRLILEGKYLDETRFLASYALKQGTVLRLAQSAEFSVTVTDREDLQVILIVEKLDTVAAVKDKIFKLKGIYPTQQELTYWGRKLEDEKTLDSYELCEAAKIRLKVADSGSSCVLS